MLRFEIEEGSQAKSRIVDVELTNAADTRERLREACVKLVKGTTSLEARCLLS